MCWLLVTKDVENIVAVLMRLIGRSQYMHNITMTS